MSNIVTVPLPHDLPENWNENQYVAPNGSDVGLTEQHGYNYLMKQVNNAQTAAAELNQFASYPHKNLLHNWDFRNPVDQKRGYIIVPGVRYYSDLAFATAAGTALDYYRVNKVNDTYGTIVMNGVSYYVNMADAVRGNFNHAVGIDRWSINPGSKGSALFVQSGGVLARLSPLHGRMSQSVTTSTSVPPTLFANKVVTASVKVESVSTDGCYLYINDGVGQSGVRLTSAGTFKVTATINSAPTGVGVVIQNTSESDYCDIKISAVKLEMGGTSSLDNDPPADYAEQASICSQYNPATGAYLGAVPCGYVESSITVASAQELDMKLDSILSSMVVSKIKFIIVDFSVQHPVLGGGTRVFRIDKIWDEYCVIQALGYREESLGAVSEFFRSKFNGTWTSWARTYNTMFKPTPAEIGAFGAYASSSNSDLNEFTSFGSKRVMFSTNKPAGASDYGLVWNILGADTGYLLQYYLDAQTRKIYRRCRIDNVWTSWMAEATTTVVPATVV